MNGWMNEWTNEWMNEWMNEKMNDWSGFFFQQPFIRSVTRFQSSLQYIYHILTKTLSTWVEQSKYNTWIGYILTPQSSPVHPSVQLQVNVFIPSMQFPFLHASEWQSSRSKQKMKLSITLWYPLRTRKQTYKWSFLTNY